MKPEISMRATVSFGASFKKLTLLTLGALVIQVTAYASQPQELPMQARYLDVLKALNDQ
jgi:hypothetical protein